MYLAEGAIGYFEYVRSEAQTIEPYGLLNSKVQHIHTNLLIATDGSELAEKAVQQHVALTKTLAASFTIMAAMEARHTIEKGKTTIAFHRDQPETGIMRLAQATLLGISGPIMC